MFITSPKKFAALFNEKYVGANREITAEDVICMTRCKLICRHGYYMRDDLEMVRGVLEYEQIQGQRPVQLNTDNELKTRKCKIFGHAMPLEPEGKSEIPKEYCFSCEPSRNRERYQKWRSKMLQIRLEYSLPEEKK
jgi:hypothetical protein